jgi:hypothetical protein
MPRTFEGNVKDGPPANGMGTTNVSDEDSGVDFGWVAKGMPIVVSKCPSHKTYSYIVVDEHLHSPWG